MDYVTVLFQVTAKTGQEKTLRSAMAAVVSQTRAEPGCIFYELHVDTENQANLSTYEIWTNKEALDRHFKQSYLESLLATVPGLIEGDIKYALKLLQPVRP